MASSLRPARAAAGAIALAAALFASGTASAATPVQTGAVTPTQIGTESFGGVAPVVDVDSAGNADIAWSNDGSSVSFCRLPSGATSCSVSSTPALPAGDTAIDALNIFATSTTSIELYATSKCGTQTGSDGGVVRWASTNSGASFGTAVCKVGADGPMTNGAGYRDALGHFLGADAHLGGGITFRALSAGTSTTTTNGQITIPANDAGGLYVDGASLGEGANALVLAANSQSDGTSGIRVAEFSGNILNLPDTSLDTAGNWSPAATVPGSTTATGEVPIVLSPSGSTQPYVAGLVGYGSGLSELQLVSTSRTGGPSGNPSLGTPTLFTGGFGDGEMDHLAATADATAFHFTWFDTGTRLLRYGTAPVDGNGAPTGPITLVGTIANVDSIGYSQPDLSTAPSGQGVDVWLGSSDQVMVAPLKANADVIPTPTPTPTPPPAPKPGGGSPTPTPVTGGSTPTPTPTPAPTTKTATSTVTGGSVELSVPTQCIAPSGIYSVTVFFAAKISKTTKGKTKVVSVKKVGFYVGGKLVVTDKKAPFKQTLKVSKTAKAGSTITVKVKAYTKASNGIGPTKTLTEKVSVCG